MQEASSTCSKDRVKEKDMALADIVRKFFIYELFRDEKVRKKKNMLQDFEIITVKILYEAQNDNRNPTCCPLSPSRWIRIFPILIPLQQARNAFSMLSPLKEK